MGAEGAKMRIAFNLSGKRTDLIYYEVFFVFYCLLFITVIQRIYGDFLFY